MKKLYILFFTLLISSLSFAQTTVFINEIHYDNDGSDENEGIEIAGPAGTNLSTYTITPYNGGTGTPYKITPLSGTIPNEDSSGYGTLFFEISSLQNGSPDGIALDNNGTLIQFLSYEGSFSATNGVANGVMSTDIGVSESSDTLPTESLQLIGSGTDYENFTWSEAIASTNNSINTGQTFGTPVPTISITSPSNSAVISSGTTSVDIVFSTTNTTAGDTVDIAVSLNGETPTTSMNVSSPFTITPIAGGEQYEVTANLIRGGKSIDSETIDFSVSYPCDLVIGTITTTCAAETTGTDKYTTSIDFTGGGTSTYTIDTRSNGIIGGDNPTTDASGTITITDVDEGTDVILTVTGNSSNSSCDITRNIPSPTCIVSVCATSGDIIITEIMKNPLIISDGDGEYFEVYNTTSSAIDMQGWIIKDDVLESELHVIKSSVVINANSYAIFAKNSETADNGGITVDYAYGNDVTLSNSGTDGLIIECSSTVIDMVVYNSSDFPNTAGTSMELSTNKLNATDNDTGSNWGNSTENYDANNKGTPRAVNNFTLSNNENKINSFKMHPNPTSLGYINILNKNSAKMEVSVFNLLGKRVIKEDLSNNQLNVSRLKSGVYILKVSQNDASVIRKLVIQ